jgi:hypothetical protein
LAEPGLKLVQEFIAFLLAKFEDGIEDLLDQTRVLAVQGGNKVSESLDIRLESVETHALHF